MIPVVWGSVKAAPRSVEVQAVVETREIEIPVVLPSGTECLQCVERLRAALANVAGIYGVQVDIEHSLLRVDFDPEELSMERLQQTAASIGVSLGQRYSHENLPLEGMDCPDCAATLERAVGRLPGVIGVSVNFPASTMHVEYEEPRVTREQVVRTIEVTGYRVTPLAAAPRRRWWQERKRELHMLVAGVLLLTGVALSLAVPSRTPSIVAFALAIVVGGRWVVRGALAALRVGTVDMNVLMTLAVIGAAAIGSWGEAALVVFLFAVGNVLEDQAMDRTRESIRSLIRLAPTHAVLLHEGREERIAVANLVPGQVVAVKPGEAVPADGVIVGGSSTVNQAPITGESTPISKRPGDPVYAGTLNELGFLEVRVTKRAGESNLARIIEMVETAQARKARSQRFMDRFAAWYTPVIVTAAVLLAAVPAVFFGRPIQQALYPALTLLLLGCPCALVISTPVTVVTGIANGARHGVLVKGGSFLEQVARMRALALDKTGTLTYGQPEVTDLVAFAGCDPQHVLSMAGALETRSGHPLAAAVTRRMQQEGVRGEPAEDFLAVPGKGARGRVAGEQVFVGSPAFLQEQGIDLGPAAETVLRLQSQGKTVILVAAGGVLLGALAVADTVREGTRETLRCLRELGVEHLVMLTGDSEQTARALAAQLGVDAYQAGLLPEDKVAAVERLRREYGTVGMVGDGVNDAPALAAANVSIAMGAAGSDTALETADVALMGDDLTRLPFLLRLGRATLSLVQMNVALAVGLKAILLVLAVPGLLTLWLAVLGDVGVSLLVIGNGLRLLTVRPIRGTRGEPCMIKP